MTSPKRTSWLAWLNKPKQEEQKSEVERLPEMVLWQTALLTDDELLVYIADDGATHYITTKPFESEKKYQVLILNHRDF